MNKIKKLKAFATYYIYSFPYPSHIQNVVSFDPYKN